MNLTDFTSKILSIFEDNNDLKCVHNAKYQIVVETGDESRFVVKLLYAPKMSKKSQKRQKILEKFDVKVSRLSYGLPMGTDIEYLDPIMISKAWDDRKVIS